MNDQALIQIDHLHRAFDGKAILTDLSWQVRPGQVIGLLGRNGAGKSTLFECLLGLNEIDSGSITLFGEDPCNLSAATRARIGYVPQQAELFPWLTPRQLLDYFRALYPRWDQARADGLLSRWQIDPHTCIEKLSGGEQQRLSIIRALAPAPELLILDEPVSSLDPVGRRDFLRQLIGEVVDRGTTVVFSTHILSDLERVAMDVAFLRDGQLALQAPLDDLLDSVRRISGEIHTIKQMQISQIIAEKTEAGQSSMLARCSPMQLAALQAKPGIAIAAITLEELFEEATR